MDNLKTRNSFVNGAISPIKIAESIAQHQSKTQIGAHSIFLGQVRADEINDKKVQAIEYTSYNEVAEIKIAEIREEIFQKYPLVCMHIYHSLGKVNVGEICFFVFTSSLRRQPAIEACNELVEKIKTNVPIWGKEIFEDNSYNWKINN